MGKCVTDVDLQAITDDVLWECYGKSCGTGEIITIVSGNKVTPTASIRLNINNNKDARGRYRYRSS